MTSAVRERRVCPVSSEGILRTRNVFQMQMSALLVQETLDFSKYTVCPHRGEGSASADISQTRREGINFSRICANIFYQCPLLKVNLWYHKCGNIRKVLRENTSYTFLFFETSK